MKWTKCGNEKLIRFTERFIQISPVSANVLRYYWNTYSLVSVMLVSGASGWIPVTPGGDEVRELCRDDNLFVDSTDG